MVMGMEMDLGARGGLMRMVEGTERERGIGIGKGGVSMSAIAIERMAGLDGIGVEGSGEVDGVEGFEGEEGIKRGGTEAWYCVLLPWWTR